MGQGYIRNDTTNQISNGNPIDADALDGEFDAIVAAFNGGTGHSHDGTTGEGGPVSVVGPSQDLTVNSTTLLPKTTDVLGLGTISKKFKDLYLSGVAYATTFTGDLVGDVTGNVTGEVSGPVTATTLHVNTSTPELRLYENDSAFTGSYWFISQNTDVNYFYWNNGTTNIVLNRQRLNSTGAVDYTFYIAGVTAAQVEPAGISSPNAFSILTREKGDERYYVKSDVDAAFNLALAKAANLGDLPSPATARANLALGSMSIKNEGTLSLNFRNNEDNDARFAPIVHTHTSASTSVAGFMSASDKTKLDGIATGADVNPATTALRTSTSTTTVLQAKAMADHVASSDHDGRYYTETEIDSALNLLAAKSANLADLQSASTARTNLGLGSLAIKNEGTLSLNFRNNADNDARFAAIADAWPGVPASTSADNVTFPIGTILTVFTSGADKDRNSSIVIRLSTSNSRDYVDTGAGAVVTGTWRSRGYCGNGFYLFQRVS